MTPQAPNSREQNPPKTRTNKKPFAIAAARIQNAQSNATRERAMVICFWLPGNGVSASVVNRDRQPTRGESDDVLNTDKSILAKRQRG